MAIRKALPDKRSELEDVVAAALRGEKVVIALDGQKRPQTARGPADPKTDEEHQKPQDLQ